MAWPGVHAGLCRLSAVIVPISASYAIRTARCLFTGPVRAEMPSIQDLRPVELGAAGVLAAGILLLGVVPASATDLLAGKINELNALFAQRIR